MKTATIIKSFVSASAVAISVATLLVIAPAPVSAWEVKHTAVSNCVDETGAIEWSFKNTEPAKDRLTMDVEISDSQTGAKTIKTVAPGNTVSGIFKTNKTKLDAGKISFKMLWTDGRSGIDTRYSSYAATDECYIEKVQPAFDASVVCSVVDQKAIYTLTVTQTAGDIDGVFTPANGDQVPSGDPIEVLGVFNSDNTSEKIVVTTDSVEDCTPEIEKPEVEQPEVLATITELPKTGAGAMVSLLGATFALGTGLAHTVQKRHK